MYHVNTFFSFINTWTTALTGSSIATFLVVPAAIFNFFVTLAEE
jgi:hypothetical protein